MAQEASETAQMTPKTPPDELREAKIVEKLIVFYDFYASSLQRHGGSKRAQHGLKTEPRQAKTAPRGAKKSRREAQNCPRGAQEGSKRAPRWATRGLQDGNRPKFGSETSPGASWHPPGPLRGVILGAIWAQKMDPEATIVETYCF